MSGPASHTAAIEAADLGAAIQPPGHVLPNGLPFLFRSGNVGFTHALDGFFARQAATQAGFQDGIEVEMAHTFTQSPVQNIRRIGMLEADHLVQL